MQFHTLDSRNGGWKDGKHREAKQPGIMESLRLEKASKILESNHEQSPQIRKMRVGIGL